RNTVPACWRREWSSSRILTATNLRSSRRSSKSPCNTIFRPIPAKMPRRRSRAPAGRKAKKENDRMRPLLIALALLAPVIACSQQSNKTVRVKDKSTVQSYTVTNPYVAYTIDPNAYSYYGANGVWSQDAFANSNDLLTYVSAGAPANDK